MNTRESGGVTPAQQRLDRLIATIGDLAEEAGLNRDTVSAVLKGGGSTRSQRRVADALTRMEEAAGIDPATPISTKAEAAAVEVGPAEEHEGYIRFELQGVYGAKAMIVSAPVGNPEELAVAVDLIMRRLRESEGSDSTEAE